MITSQSQVWSPQREQGFRVRPLLANIMHLLSQMLVKKEFALHLVIGTLQGEFYGTRTLGFTV